MTKMGQKNRPFVPLIGCDGEVDGVGEAFVPPSWLPPPIVESLFLPTRHGSCAHHEPVDGPEHLTIMMDRRPLCHRTNGKDRY